jgi:cysteine-rich repeat protein
MRRVNHVPSVTLVVLMLMLVLVGSGGCFDPQFSDHPLCGPGAACPDGTQCLRQVCVITGCSNAADGASCANTNVENGVCYHHGCVPFGCGDGVIEPGEICDDGNLVSGDGCSANCQSVETCGNGIVDFAIGEQCDEGVPGLTGDSCSSACTAETRVWADITPTLPPARDSLAMAFDIARDRAVLFGGSSAAGRLGDTWEFDGTTWAHVITRDSPSPRFGHAMVYDSARHVVVLVGGIDPSGRDLADTWTYDAINWTQVFPATPPPARAFAALAFDSDHGRVILFGGADPANHNDVWSFDGATWTQVPITGTQPSPRSGAAMVFDPVHHNTMMFGGLDPTAGRIGDTWLLDASGWTHIDTSGDPQTPPFRDRAGLVFDTSRNLPVLVAGGSNFGILGDTWTFDGAHWTGNIVFLSARAEPGAVYDPVRARVLVFGGVGNAGLLNDTVSVTAMGSSAVTVPVAASLVTSAVFDPAINRVVGFGGTGPLLQPVWLFNGASWRSRLANNPPQVRTNAALVYDSRRDRIVMFGGRVRGDLVDETWEFDGASWTQRTPIRSPGARLGVVGMAYDSRRGRVVLLGRGIDTDTWEFDSDANTWVQLSTPTLPRPRESYFLTYDIALGKTVLFGGSSPDSSDFGTVFRNDTWVFDGADWAEVHTMHAPSRRDGFGFAYDAGSERVVLFGGTVDMTFVQVADTWIFDGSDWTEVHGATAPSARSPALEVFDSTRGQIVLFGGSGHRNGLPVTFDDTWSLSLVQSFAPRDLCFAGLDSDGDGRVMCGDPSAVIAADPDCADYCTPTCNAQTDRYDPRAASTTRLAPNHCDLTGTAFCGDGICQPPREDYTRCPGDCPVAPTGLQVDR